MYLLIDMIEKKGWSGKDMTAISKKSKVSINTIKKWKLKGIYVQTLRYIFVNGSSVVGKPRGIYAKNKKNG
jgi:hypothetical protein